MSRPILPFAVSATFVATAAPAPPAKPAAEQGAHRFCQFDTGKCEGIADFTVVWQQRGESWEITRVLSYGHRAVVQ